MASTQLREFRRTEGGSDGRITINLTYLISVAPSQGVPDQTVIRVATGRGFEEYTLRSSYDQVTASLADSPADELASAYRQ